MRELETNGEVGELPVAAGDLVAGKYRVERVIGLGGMGVVVAAHHVELDQPVALKILLPQSAEREDAGERFVREARIAARLKSSHVARIVDVGTLPSGLAFMVMELLEGKDLESVLFESGPISPATAVEYVLQTCDAVAEAHAHGIVHRNLKPANLFVTKRRDGTPLVKVLDFGISKIFRGNGGSNPRITSDTGITGSPQYMSPEQIRGRRLDERSDIWALGVVLYELVSGRCPFDAETAPDVFARVLQSNPNPLAEVAPHVPVAFRDIVERCLKKEREHRFANIADFAASLEAVFTASIRIRSVAPAWLPAPPSSKRTDALETKPEMLPTSRSKTAKHRRRLQLAVLGVMAACAAIGVYAATRISTNTAHASSTTTTTVAATEPRPDTSSTTSSLQAPAVAASQSVASESPGPTPTTSSAVTPSQAPSNVGRGTPRSVNRAPGRPHPQPSPTGHARTEW